MLIDWFTVIAQIINFVILIWLMKKFLYQPILHAIDEREKRVADALADADAKDKQAEELRITFQQKNAELAEHSAEMLKKADDETALARQKMLVAAQAEAAELRKAQLLTLQKESERQHQAIKEQIQQEVLAIARQALQDMAEVSLDEQILRLFLQRLRSMDEKEKGDWRSRIQQGVPAVQFHSSWELSPQQKQQLHDALKDEFAVDIEINYTLAPKLVSGVELISQGYKMAWNIADYLNSLQNNLLEISTNAEAVRTDEVAKQ